MYLKNGLIEFLKVKNVILLILGVTFTSISFSLMTQLVVGLHGDFLSIIRAGSLIAAFVFFVFGVSMIVYSRISRMMINEAVFFSGYFEGDLNGYVDFAELAEVCICRISALSKPSTTATRRSSSFTARPSPAPAAAAAVGWKSACTLRVGVRIAAAPI